MKKVLLAVLPLLAVAQVAAAQGGGLGLDPNNKETMKVTLIGNGYTAAKSRDAALNLVNESPSGASGGETAVHGAYSFGVNAELSNQVKVHILLATQHYALNSFTTTNSDLLGDGSFGESVAVREASIT